MQFVVRKEDLKDMYTAKKSFSSLCHLLFCLLMSSKAAERQRQQQRPQAAPVWPFCSSRKGSAGSDSSSACKEGHHQSLAEPTAYHSILPLPSSAVMQHHWAGDPALASWLIKLIEASLALLSH